MSTIFRRTSRSWMHGTSRTRLPMSLWSPSSILAKYFSGMKWVYASMRMEALRLVHGKDGGHGICPQQSPRRKADGNTSMRTNNVDQRLAAVVRHRIARAGERGIKRGNRARRVGHCPRATDKRPLTASHWDAINVANNINDGGQAAFWEQIMDVNGHAALVTGGGSGLGAGTAEALVEAARAVAQRIGGLAVQCDVADADSAAAAVAQARERHGAARILINCAGIGPPKRIVGRDGPMPLGDYDRVIRGNLIGSFNMMRLAAADMSKLEPLADNERGVIVSTASVAAYEGQIGQAAYASSKGGVVGLNLPAARELAQFGIRVMTIAPGLFLTPLLRSLPEDVQASLSASVPFPKRLGDPREFADTVLFIVRSAYLNGEVIRLDGALRMAPR